MYRDRYKKDPKPKNPNEGISQKGDKGKLPKDNPQRKAKGDKLPMPKDNPQRQAKGDKLKSPAPKPKAKPAAPAKASEGSPAPKPKLKPTSGSASGKMAYEAPKAAGKLTSYQRTVKLVASRDVAQPKRRK